MNSAADQNKKGTFLKLAIMLAIIAVLAGYYTYTQVFGGSMIGKTLTSNPDLTEDILLHWTFDGSDMDWSTSTAEVGDRSGNANRGNITGFSSDQVRLGRIGQGVYLDGTDDYIHASLSETVRTVAFWAKPNSLTGSLMDLTDSGGDDWYDRAYTYCRPVTMTAGSSGGVATTTTGGFPLVATSTIADLRASIHGGKVEIISNDAPVDIIFTNGTNCKSDGGSAVLDYYFEDYASTTGAFVVWVEPTDISSTTGKTLLMYYGNPDAIAQDDREGVSGSLGEVGTWNLSENPANAGIGGVLDATSNNNDGTDHGSMNSADLVSGKSDGAFDFDGTDDYLTVEDSASLDFTTGESLTIVKWVRPVDLDGYQEYIIKGRLANNTNANYAFRQTDTGALEFYYQGTPSLTWHTWTSSGPVVTAGDWTHVAVRYRFGTGSSIRVYANGSEVSGSWTSGNGNETPLVNTDKLVFASKQFDNTGGGGDPDTYYQGAMDDVRIYDRALDAADIRTIYNNTNNSSAFWTFGEEEVWGGGTVLFSGGSIETTGFVSPSIYVDGEAGSTFSDTGWHHVVVASDSGLNIGTVEAGRITNSYFQGEMDDIRVYGQALSAEEVSRLYELGATTKIGKTLDANSDLESGLVGHWTFDGSDMDWSSTTGEVRDRSGNANYGNAISLDPGAGTIGKLGQALTFDGVDDYVRIGNGTNGLIEGSTQASVCFWLNYGASSVTQDGAVVTNWDADGWLIWVDDIASVSGRTNTIAFSVDASASGPGRVEGTTDLVTPGVWDHYCGTYRGGSFLRLYKNGILNQQNTTSIIPDVESTTEPLYIGNSDSASAIKFLNGKLDDIRIYNRALSAEEVSRLYELGATTKIGKTLDANPDLESGIIGHWTFDGSDMDWSNTTAEARDQSGNGKHGNVTNFNSDSVVMGKMGQALSFDGTDDYISLGGTQIIGDDTTFTISAWIRGSDDWEAVANNWQHAIYGEFNGENNTKNYLFVGGGQFPGIEGDIFFDQFPPSGGSTIINGPIATHQWHHVVGVRNGSQNMLYINGELGNTGTAETYSGSVPNSVRIGSRPEGGETYYFKGAMDDVRIYNRALSAEEIKRLYELGN